MRTYKLRVIHNGKAGSGEKYVNYSMTVPPEIARMIPEGMEFECSWDDDGIHYTPAVRSQQKLPTWATTNGAAGENGAADTDKPKRLESS